MSIKARFATAHRLRFPKIAARETLDLTAAPTAALSWKIGPAGEVGPDGYRLPSDIWCAVGLFREEADARAALQATEQFLPFLPGVSESWHALLLPVMHRGECNHLNREQPGTIFESSDDDPGGHCMVITTAGFIFGPGLDINRVIDFRRNVDVANTWMGQADGCLANQVFTPHVVGEDGITMSIWRDDASMLAAAYRPGEHRSQLDRHKVENLFDRSSFTRFRILESFGTWDSLAVP